MAVFDRGSVPRVDHLNLKKGAKMSIVRMLKSFAAAALAVAASAVSAAEVISINFTQDGYGAYLTSGFMLIVR